jgi:hypothetical protein
MRRSQLLEPRSHLVGHVEATADPALHQPLAATEDLGQLASWRA